MTPQQSRPGQNQELDTISLCMMVKNEEKNLPRLLESVVRWVDEIIVVDTGSEDRTVEIAQSYGAQIYHHPWEHNFSKHRNQSISYASKDWILILDADEELDQQTAPRMKPFLTKAPPEVNAVFLEMYNELPSGMGSVVMHPRLFRNHVGFHYEGLVHNDPKFKGNPAKLSVKLYHYGYNLDEETMDMKHERRVLMLKKWLENEPDNYAAHAYMAQTLMNMPETRAEAVEWALKALKLADEQGYSHLDYPRSYYPLMASLADLGRDEETEKYSLACAEKVPTYPDPYQFLSHVAFKQNRWQDTANYANKFLELQDYAQKHPEDFRFIENMTVNQIGQNLYRLVLSQAALGEFEQAQANFKLLVEVEQDEHCAQQVLQAMMLKEHHDFNLKLNQIVEESGRDWPWSAFFYQMALSLSNKPKANELAQLAAQAEREGDLKRAQEIFLQSLELNQSSPEALTGMGRVLMKQKALDEAEDYLLMGLSAQPGQSQAWKLLGDLLFERGEHKGALAYYQGHLDNFPGDEGTAGRVTFCQRRISGGETGPTVLESPPQMVIFLVGDMSPDVVRLGGPHMLLNRAWGEFFSNEGEKTQPNLPTWATLYTGREQKEHGIASEQNRKAPLDLSALNCPSIWDVISAEHRLGLMAVPLGHPAPQVNGWSVSGHPAGLFNKKAAQPEKIIPTLMAQGYRPDLLASDFEDQIYAQNLHTNRAYEAQLYQIERNKIKAALALPAVDVLAVGLTVLERLQTTFAADSDRVFSAYHQVYGWMETMLAALHPKSYVVLSQRGCPLGGTNPSKGGFYCLSWLKGQNARAMPKDIAPEILKRLALNSPGESPVM